MKRVLRSILVLMIVLGAASAGVAADPCSVVTVVPSSGPSQVPEPSTLLFLLSGLTGMVLYRKTLKK